MELLKLLIQHVEFVISPDWQTTVQINVEPYSSM